MPTNRSILIDGLGKTLRRLPALLWTYAFSVLIAFALSYPLWQDLSSLLDHSLAAQSLTNGFDIGSMMAVLLQLHEHGGAAQARNASGVAVAAYLLLYFLLVPGTLHSYTARSKATLSNLLGDGIRYFWRFVRITVLSSLAFLLVLGPLMALQSKWASLISDRFVGVQALVLRFAGLFMALLVASLIRLYFDLVEVYTVQMGSEVRSDERVDRRVRRTLQPALELLRRHLLRAWLVFLLIAAFGAFGSMLLSRAALHMLAKPAAWPLFLTAQAGILVSLLARFWQRGAEVSLAAQYPLPFLRPGSLIPFSKHSSQPAAWEHPQHVGMIYNTDPLAPIYPAPLSAEDPMTQQRQDHVAKPSVIDLIPSPEPPAPPLDEPDPGVFHHDPGKS